MKSYNIEVTREVTLLETAYISVDANNEEEAMEIALLNAEGGYIDTDQFSHDEFPSVRYETFVVEDE